MLRVLHINTSKTWRGGEQQLAYLLENKNVEQCLICIENSALEQYAKENNYQYFSIKNQYAYLKTLQLIKQLHPDIIHVHDSKAHTLAYIISFLYSEKINVVVHRRVIFPPKNSWLTKKKYNANCIKKIICVSKAVQHEMKKITIDATKIEVIYSAVDNTKFSSNNTEKNEHKQALLAKYNLSENAIIIGTAAAIEKEKNLEEFIFIAQKLTQKDVNIFCFIAGNGTLYSTYKQQYETDKLRFIGFQSDMRRVYNSMDVFLLTSEKEGLGTAVLEAMSAGVPVVCHNFETASEIIENKKNGYVYTDKKEAVELLQSFVYKKEQQDYIIKNAHNTLQQKFDKDKMNENILHIYHSLLKTQS